MRDHLQNKITRAARFHGTSGNDSATYVRKNSSANGQPIRPANTKPIKNGEAMNTCFASARMIGEQHNIIRVLCVDGHPLMRGGIASTLDLVPEIKVVAEAANAHDAIVAFRLNRPDIVLMDIQLTDMCGIEAILRIREEFPRARCIVLTTHNGDVQVSRALKAGASGYLLKTMARHDLIQAIQTVHSGQRYIQPEVACRLAGHIDADSLSTREIEVLATISEGLSNKIVADKLCITEDTVKGHMRNILSKLRANDRTDAVLIAMKRGYLDIWRVAERR